MATTINVAQLIKYLESLRNKNQKPEPEIAYRFSNGREFERKKDPYGD
jgi:hypothetical protein